MFEQVCLACGKHLPTDDNYCSQRCESGDRVSPSLSSASSTLSSPYLGYNDNSQSDIPVPLLALDPLSHAYASSASSTCWSATDDEEGEESPGYTSDYRQHDDVIIEPHSKPTRYLPQPAGHHAMNFARRPSGINNPGISATPSERGPSQTPSTLGVPKSAPIHSYLRQSSPTSEDESLSDPSRDESDYTSLGSPRPREKKRHSSTTKTKRSKNRTSLPTYFSLLQLESQTCGPKPNSSSNTINRLSPPTPRVGNPTTSVHAITALPLSQNVDVTAPAPRGRRKVADRFSHTAAKSGSSSRERSGMEGPICRRSCDGETSVEQVFDWPPALDPRDRQAVRRNSSPPPKMLESSRMVVHKFGECTLKEVEAQERRGRYRAEEFPVPVFGDAPGMGLGRSGLVGRRGTTQRW